MILRSTRAWLFLLLGTVISSFSADLRQEVVSQREDLKALQEKFAQVQNDVQAMKGEHDAMQTDIERLKKDVKQTGDSLDDLKKEVARLEELIKRVDALREQDRKTIVEEVSKEIDRLVKKPSRAESATSEKPPKAAKPQTQEGYEHVVEKGQTLAAIAEVYGVTTKTIMEANHLKKTDLKVGQKLFIPAEEKKIGKPKSKKPKST